MNLKLSQVIWRAGAGLASCNCEVSINLKRSWKSSQRRLTKQIVLTAFPWCTCSLCVANSARADAAIFIPWTLKSFEDFLTLCQLTFPPEFSFGAYFLTNPFWICESSPFLDIYLFSVNTSAFIFMLTTFAIIYNTFRGLYPLGGLLFPIAISTCDIWYLMEVPYF